MENLDFDNYVQLSRIRSVRTRKRIQREDYDKKLIRLHKEERVLWEQMRNLGWTALTPPIQRGFIRFFILRPDVARTKQAAFFGKILTKINTNQWSCRKDFKKKRKKFGKKIYAAREQKLRDLEEREFFGNKFTEQERFYFYETLTHSKQSKKPIKIYRFIEPWRFVLRIQPNMITKVRVKDLDLERKSADIGRFFNFDNRRIRLWKILDGSNRWKWDHLPNDKYKNPLHNRSFSDILNEYLPEPQLTVSHKNPRELRGFSFLECVNIFLRLIHFRVTISFTATWYKSKIKKAIKFVSL